VYAARAMHPLANPFVDPLAPADSRTRPVVAHRRVHGGPCAASPGSEAWTLVDIAISSEGRAFETACTVDTVHALPERVIPVLTHAGPMAGAFLVERPLAVSDVITTFGRRPHALSDDEWHALLARYVDATERLVALGATAVILSVDEGGLLASALSPRANPLESEAVRVARVTSCVRALSSAHAPSSSPVPLGLALTVEERFPGGIDARLGVDTARACVEAGVSFIVAGRETGDIDREAPALVDTGDPVLASAAWLVGRVSVPVYACGTSVDVPRTAARARAFGLAGFVCRDDVTIGSDAGHA
jgi:2,4-dienoyl-CoA reductase-like NADH-dependent reductase (Old Yellow Enzyme family)